MCALVSCCQPQDITSNLSKNGPVSKKEKWTRKRKTHEFDPTYFRKYLAKIRISTKNYFKKYVTVVTSMLKTHQLHHPTSETKIYVNQLLTSKESNVDLHQSFVPLTICAPRLLPIGWHHLPQGSYSGESQAEGCRMAGRNPEKWCCQLSYMCRTSSVILVKVLVT